MGKTREHGNDEAVRGLIRQLAHIEAAVQQVLGDDVDAVTDPDSGAALLLPRAQARLRRELEEQVAERTAELQNAYEELQQANEELQVAGEELQQQNAELAAARADLEAERRRYYELFDFAPDGYLATDPLGTIQEANRAAALLLGVEARFLAGKPLAAFASGDGARILSEYLARLDTREDTEPLRWRMALRPREGEPFVAALTAAPVCDAEGRLEGLRWLLRDVSERVAMEEALRTGEERYRLVADFTYDWEYWTGPNGEFRYVSPACQRITGYRPGEFQRDPDLVARIVHPDDLPRWEAHRQAEAKRGEVQAIEFRIRTRDGRERWIGHVCQPVYGEDGTWLGWRGSNRDITARKEAEAERERLLAAAEDGRRTLDALMEYVPQGITLASAAGMQVTRVSRFGQELLGGFHAGWSVGQIAEQWTIFETDAVTPMAEEDLPLVRAIQHGEVVKDQELIQVNARGDRLWLSCDAGPIYGPAGEVTDGVVAWREVTEQKRAEQALRDSERRYRQLFESMTEGFALHEIICDARGRPVDYRFLEVNPTFERLTGLDSGDLLGKTVLEVLPDTEPFWIETYGRVALGGEPAYFEQYSRALGRHYAVSAYRPAENQFACLFQDITERKEAERVLCENEEKLRALFELLPVGLSILDAERTMYYQNPTLVRILDLAPEALQDESRQRQRAYVRPDGSPMPPEEFPSVRATEEGRIVRDVEIGVVKEDGTETWVNVTAAPLPFDDWNVIIVTADITEQVLARRRIEELAAEARRRADELDAVFDAMTDPVTTYDATGRPVRANPAALAAYGLDPALDGREEAMRKLAVRHSDGRPVAREELLSSRALRGETVRGQRFLFTDARGQDLTILASASPLRADGKVVGAVTVWRDVTERELLLAETQRQRQVFEQLIDVASIGIAVVCGPELRFELVNPAYRAIPGTPDTPMLGRTFAEVFPGVDPQGGVGLFEQALDTGQTAHVREYEAAVGPTREKTYWNVDVVPLPETDGGPKRALILTHEVTEQVLARKRIEELAAVAQHRADELDAVFDAMTDAVVVYDASGALVQANRAAIAGYGFDPVGLERRELGDRIAARYPDGRPVPVDEFLHVRALRGETVRDQPYLMTAAPGQDMHVLTSAAPLRHGGEIVGAVVAWRDVTSQVEAEQARDRLIAILEETPDMVSFADLEGRILYCNRAVRRILGVPDGADLSEATIPDAHPDWAMRLVQEEGIPTAMREGVWQGRSAMHDSDGKEVPVSQVILAHRGHDGRAEYLSTIARDVRREQAMLAQLETEQARLRTIFDSAPEGIVVADAEGRILLTNPAADRLYAHPVPYGQEYESHASLQLRRPDGPPYDPRDLPLTRSALDGEVVREEEVDIVWPDGQQRHLLVNTAPIRAGEGHITGAVGVFQDVTERRRMAEALRRARDELEQRVEERTADLVRLTENLRAEISVRVHTEQELRASEARFRQMAETIDEVFMLIDPASQRFLYLSPRYETIWGRPREEAYQDASALLETVLPEDRERLLAAWQAGAGAYDEEFRLQRPDGQLRWIRLRAFAIRDDEGAVRRLAGVAQDMTREKRAQGALIQAERLSMAGQLAASLAHEINNPIQSALGCLDLAVETLEDGEDPRNYLEVTIEAVARAARVVSQLRSLHRESPAERPQPTDVRALLDRVLLLTRKRCESGGVEVDVQAEEPLPPLPLRVDGMQQVFLNLVLNAVEAMPGGGRLTIRAAATDGPPGVAIRFGDTGGGMPPDVLAQMFEPFFTTKKEGLGLGLFVSQNIVRQHGGHIDIESQAGQGTTFTVWLPAAEEEEPGES